MIRLMAALVDLACRPLDWLLMRSQARLDDDHPLVEYRDKEKDR